MKGKIGLVVGLGVGYVLGTRAGRERYEQIKKQWLKIWDMDPVQNQVERAKAFVGTQAAAVPGAVWTGVVKVVKAVGDGRTPGEKLDSAVATSKKAAAEVKDAAEEVAQKASAPVKKTPAKKTPAKKTPAKSRTTSQTGAKKPTTNGK